MNQLGDQEAQTHAYSQVVKKLEAQLVTFQKQQLSLNEKLTFQANEIYEKDEKLKKYRRIGMKAVKEKEQLQKTLDSWKDSSKNLWRLINSGMSSSKEDSVGKPLYSRFIKTNDFKGVPHPLSGDYTPKPQEEIDESLYVYGKKGPQEPEPSVSDDRSSEYSTCQSNDSAGSIGTSSEHSLDPESEISRVPPEVYVSTPITTNEKGVSAPKSKEVKPSCVTHIKTPRQPIKDQATPKVNRKNWNAMMERELGEGYSFTKKKCFVCGSLSHLIKDCDYYEKKMAREAEFKKQRVFNTGNGVAKPVWTNANRVNHANQFVPRSVQLNAGRPNINSVRPNINTGRTNINSVRPRVNTGRTNINSVRPNINTGRVNVNSVRPNVNTGRVNVNSVRPNVNTGRVNVNSVKSNVNTGRTNVNPVRPRVNTGSSNVNTVRSRQPVPTKTSNSFSPKRPQVNQLNQRRHFSKSHSPVSRPIVRNTTRMTYSHAVKGNWGTAVKTSTELAIPGKMTTGKESSNPLMADNLPKNCMVINSPYLEVNEVQDKGYIGDFVMSDSEHSTITYTEVSSEFEDLSDIGSPRNPPPPDLVPDPVYPEFMPPEDDDPEEDLEPAYPKFMPHDDDVFPAEKKPLPAVVSPTTGSPDDDVEEEESSGDDADDEEEEEDEDEEKEEHLAPADSVPRPTYRTTARIYYLHHYQYHHHYLSPPPLPVSPTHPLGYRAAMIRLRAESPSTSHPLPLLPPIVLPHTRESMAMMRAAAPSTYCLAPPSGTPPSGTPPILPIPLPTSSPPLLLPSTDCRVNVPEVTLPPRKRLCIAPDPRYEIRETSSALTARSTGGFRADYGFVGTLDAKIGRDPDREIGYRITDIWVDPDEIVEEIPIVDLLHRDRRSHARTTRLMKSEARASREAWVQSMDASDTTRSEAQLIEALTLLKILQTQMVALQSQQRPARDPAHPDVPEEAGSSS
ncbi:hypothetical protein Tco_0559908 [Tanacetum coccineum]